MVNLLDDLMLMQLEIFDIRYLTEQGFFLCIRFCQN